MKSNINVKQTSIVAQRVFVSISLFSVALVLLMLSGCGPKTEATTPLPAGYPQTSEQPSSEGGDSSAASELPSPQSTEIKGASPSPTQTGSTRTASTLSPEGEVSLNEFMAKVNERLDLDDTQQDKVRSAVRTFLIGMEMKVQQGQGIGQSGQGRQGSGRPDLTDKQREEMAQTKQMGGPGQVIEQLQDVLTADQMEVFQKLMDELRQEMILQRTIKQMGGTTPQNDQNK